MSSSYRDILKDRAKKSRVYKKYQLTGLMIAHLLKDDEHKALYIKLAKDHSQSKLLSIARDVADRGPVRSKGAYFMSIVGRLGIRYNKKPRRKPHQQLKLLYKMRKLRTKKNANHVNNK